jgi:hypothetical protein
MMCFVCVTKVDRHWLCACHHDYLGVLDLAKMVMLFRILRCRGYVVSPFGQDGFALLKADKILESIGGTKGSGGGSGASKKAGRKQMLRNSVE